MIKLWGNFPKPQTEAEQKAQLDVYFDALGHFPCERLLQGLKALFSEWNRSKGRPLPGDIKKYIPNHDPIGREYQLTQEDPYRKRTAEEITIGTQQVRYLMILYMAECIANGKMPGPSKGKAEQRSRRIALAKRISAPTHLEIMQNGLDLMIEEGAHPHLVGLQKAAIRECLPYA